MSKHTAGPWKFKRVNNVALAKNSSVNLLTDDEGFNLGLLSTWRNSPESEAEAEANARLIAAAPDLLEALIKAQLVIEWAPERYQDNVDLADAARALLPELNGIIAKARGEA